MFELVQEIGRRSMLPNLYFSIFRNCKGPPALGFEEN